MNKKFDSESRLSFMEATSIIVGHGVGAGILAVPYIASRNSWQTFALVIFSAYLISFLMHCMIAELSYNNDGAQFITCLNKDFFKGKFKKALTIFSFIVLGISEIVKVGGYITGAASVLTSWFGIPEKLAIVLYYIIASGLVLFGMKAVGILENLSLYAMIGVILILFVSTITKDISPLPDTTIAPGNVIALYSIVSFALSAVMSVPQVVKGLNGDVKKIRGAIALGSGLNVFLIAVISIMTLIGAGKNITSNGALVDLSKHLGGWVGVVGYIFTLLALSTSLWACTLNLRDVVHEQTKVGLKPSWLIASLPCLLIAVTGLESFVGLTRLSSATSVLLGIAVIIAYSRSRKRANNISPIVGKFGSLAFRILVVLSTLISTVGSFVSVK